MKISVTASQPTNNSQLQNKEMFHEKNESKAYGLFLKCESTSAELPQPKMSELVIPLTSLFELEQQEKHRRRKKSVPKKKVPVYEMRNKLKQLMNNISNTFNDMDWYFALEQLENQNPDIGDSSPRKKMRKYEVRKMNKVDDQNSDGFLDQFIQQMYEINPVFVDKIRSRIDKEISSNKRQIRLALPSEDSFNIRISSTENPHAQPNKFNSQRKEIVKSVQIRDLIPAYNENEDYYYEIDQGPGSYSNTSSQRNEFNSSEKENYNKRRHQSNVEDEDFFVDSSGFTTSTTSTTTLEAFYDLGDYYRESDDDYDGQGIRDIEEYEINKDIIETSTDNLIEELDRINEKIIKSKDKGKRYKDLRERNRLKNSPRRLSSKRKLSN